MTPFWQLVSIAVLAAIFAWWFSTGLLFIVVRQRRTSHPWSFAGSTAMAVAAFGWIIAMRGQETVAAAYGGFVAALVLWGWQELAFLMGYITGHTRRQGPTRHGLWHFKDAAMAIIYHEIAIALTGLALIWVSWGAANQVAMWTYIILWTMRLSAKFNVFLGVPNLNADLLPDHLRFLKAYFAQRPINYFFPFSVMAPTVVAGAILGHLATADPIPFETVGHSLLGTLIALAILEHWFLVLPISDSALWRWALGERMPEPAGDGSDTELQRFLHCGPSGVMAYRVPSSKGT